MILRIVFFGTPSFAIPTLKKLLRGTDEIVAVVTQPDRRRGRGQKTVPPSVKALIQDYPMPVLQPEKVKEEDFRKRLSELNPDLFVVVAYGQILPECLLLVPRFGSINVHASLLPQYRGAAPIPWAILKGEKVTGVTTMMMDRGMDTGSILLQEELSVEEQETGGSLQEKLAALGAEVLSKTLEKLRAGNLHPVPQDHSKATYAPPITKESGRIDWSREAAEIDRRVRAFDPNPGAFTRWNGRLLKIYKGEVRERASEGRPGEVVWVGSDFIEVATGKGLFLIREIQQEGKRRMNAREFLVGHPISVGTVFE